MKILLIEDHEDKRQKIIDFFVEEFPESQIDEAMSYNSACKALSRSSWDLLLIDMSIPTFDKSASETGGRPRPLGGKQLIRRINKKKIDTPFIIITQFSAFSDDGKSISAEQIDLDIQKLGNKNYLGMILYNIKRSDWKSQLTTHVNAISHD